MLQLACVHAVCYRGWARGTWSSCSLKIQPLPLAFLGCPWHISTLF